MKVIADDGQGLAVLLDVARKVSELLVNHNVTLGVGYNDGEEHPVAVITANANGYRVGVTIEPRARIVDLGGDDTTPTPKREGSAHHDPQGFSHYSDGTTHCVCVLECCSGGRRNGSCICLTCTDSSHAHG